jgi:hypothetical protein
MIVYISGLSFAALEAGETNGKQRFHVVVLACYSFLYQRVRKFSYRVVVDVPRLQTVYSVTLGPDVTKGAVTFKMLHVLYLKRVL